MNTFEWQWVGLRSFWVGVWGREVSWSCGLGILIFIMQSLLLITQNSNLKVANFLLADCCQTCCFPHHQPFCSMDFSCLDSSLAFERLCGFGSTLSQSWLRTSLLQSILSLRGHRQKGIANTVFLRPPREPPFYPSEWLLGQRLSQFSSTTWGYGIWPPKCWAHFGMWCHLCFGG